MNNFLIVIKQKIKQKINSNYLVSLLDCSYNQITLCTKKKLSKLIFDFHKIKYEFSPFEDRIIHKFLSLKIVTASAKIKIMAILSSCIISYIFYKQYKQFIRTQMHLKYSNKDQKNFDSHHLHTIYQVGFSYTDS